MKWRSSSDTFPNSYVLKQKSWYLKSQNQLIHSPDQENKKEYVDQGHRNKECSFLAFFITKIFFLTNKYLYTYKSSTTFYPPPLPPAWGGGLKHMYIVIMMLLSISQVIAHNDYIYIDIQYWNPLHSINKAYLHTSLFLFGFLVFVGIFALDCLLWYNYIGTEYSTFIVYILWYSDGACSVSGGAHSPPPVTRPPPVEPYFMQFCSYTCALIGVI